MRCKKKLFTLAGIVALILIDYLVSKNIDGVIGVIATLLLAKTNKKKKKH